MSEAISERLNQILPRITSADFLSGEGIGNEIACYIFDYDAADELKVRDHITWMIGWMTTHHGGLDVLHLDLFDVVMDYLKQRGLFEKALKMREAKGDSALLSTLKGPLAAEKIRDFIAVQHQPQHKDLLLLSGVGSVWPMLRAHSLLNCLHTAMGQTPLVMFYPGHFDGTTLTLFGQIAARVPKPGGKPYYRAFTLVPRETPS